MINQIKEKVNKIKIPLMELNELKTVKQWYFPEKSKLKKEMLDTLLEIISLIQKLKKKYYKDGTQQVDIRIGFLESLVNDLLWTIKEDARYLEETSSPYRKLKTVTKLSKSEISHLAYLTASRNKFMNTKTNQYFINKLNCILEELAFLEPHIQKIIIEIDHRTTKKLPDLVFDSLLEAKKCSDEECYSACGVILGVALENCLAMKYKEIEGKEPKTADGKYFLNLGRLLVWAQNRLHIPSKLFEEAKFTKWARNVSAHYSQGLKLDENDIPIIFNSIIKIFEFVYLQHPNSS